MSNKETDNKRYSKIKKIDIRTFTMLAVLIILWVFFTALTSKGFSDLSTSFLSFRNLSNLFRQMAIVGIMGSTMVLIIVTQGIDLSAGMVVGFIGCVAAACQVYYGIGTAMTIVIAIILGVIVYAIQGALIAYAGIAPFIVTLGGQLVFNGLILAVTKGATIAPLKESLVYFGQAYVSKTVSLILGLVVVAVLLLNELQRRASKRKNDALTESSTAMIIRWVLMSAVVMIAILVMNSYRGMPIPVLILFVVVFIVTLIAEKTTFGRKIYAIGGNLDAAKYAGINVRKNLMMVYMLHGVTIAIAGLIYAARLNAGSASVANAGLELDAIAAAVIGGTSMSGGVGKVAGAILGALIMASIDNGMSMMNLDAYWQFIVKGLILVAAVWFDSRTNKK